MIKPFSLTCQRPARHTQRGREDILHPSHNGVYCLVNGMYPGQHKIDRDEVRWVVIEGNRKREREWETENKRERGTENKGENAENEWRDGEDLTCATTLQKESLSSPPASPPIAYLRERRPKRSKEKGYQERRWWRLKSRKVRQEKSQIGRKLIREKGENHLWTKTTLNRKR